MHSNQDQVLNTINSANVRQSTLSFLPAFIATFIATFKSMLLVHTGVFEPGHKAYQDG